MARAGSGTAELSVMSVDVMSSALTLCSGIAAGKASAPDLCLMLIGLGIFCLTCRLRRVTHPITMPFQINSAKSQFERDALRCFSVADFNCPQAAIMSSPRGLRIGLA